MKHGNGGEKGCRLGKRCKDFHPFMCTESLRKKECYDNSCSNYHIKGTKRKKEISQNTQSINNQKCGQKDTQNNKTHQAIAFQLAETNAGDNNTSITTSSTIVELSFLEALRQLKAEIF